MVMHARKQPRVNDGYNERKDAHLHQVHQWLDRHQSMQHQQNYSGIYADGSPAEGNHGHSAQSDSPGRSQSPRYHNKGPYLERGKEKRGSLSLAEKKVNQYLATGSIGQNAPGAHRDHREQRPDGNHHEGGNHSNHGQDKNSATKRPGDHKDGKDHRAEVQKSAVRVCGDWSEHISSSGKRYYFNCKSEVSQWEKPKEWNDSARAPDKGRDYRGNAKPSTSSATFTRDERARHSSTNEQRYDGRNRPAYMDSSSGTPEKSLQRPTDRSKSQSVDVPNSSSTSGSNMHRGSTVSRSNSSSAETSYNHSGQVAHSSHTGYTSHPDLKRNSVFAYGSASGEPARRRSRLDSDNSRPINHPSHRSEDNAHQGDLEMSPCGSSSCTVPSSSAAIQTLQELQKVLSLHIKKQQSKGGSQTTSSSSGTTSAQLQSQLHHLQHNILQHQHQSQQHHQHQQQQPPLDLPPHVSPHHPHSSMPTSSSHGMEEGLVRDQNQEHQREQDGCESPVSDTSQRSSCRSPTPSAGSCHDAPAIGTSALSAAALKSQQSVTLSPSLSNYYNENLIGHVLGWQAEQMERQAERLHQDSLAFSSIHCSRVSVELKRARSNVRTAEIQSTIQEQRIMVLQQQRMEIENLKPPTSLLPS
ncbi:WW domain-containing adapter protein with coiled-coil-like [Babylonia areolata]|uniref:WW domain-containing adapter protein with coiled-coil-like n=1 Tax=Babylonia areolata TaxID=304850 RepID=UPI003FD1F2E8